MSRANSMRLDGFDYRGQPPLAYHAIRLQKCKWTEINKNKFSHAIRRIKYLHAHRISVGGIGDVCEMRSITANI